jgi:acylphosphatase
MRVSRHYVVRGRVQGVGFRQFTWHAARVEGLHGWVRNRADGSVEVLADGEHEAIERFERQLRRGPGGARVDEVDVEPATPGEGGQNFDVR